MQINEINWLHNKKSDLLKEIIELQLKSQKVFTQHDTLKNLLEKQLKQKDQILKQVKKNSSNQISSLQKKIQQLQALHINNDKQIQRIKLVNEDYQNKNQASTFQMKKLTEKLQQKQKQIEKINHLKQLKFSEQQESFSRQLEREQQKITQIVSKYENLIIQKQNFYKGKYQKQMQQIRQQNQALIKKLEEKYLLKQSTQKQDDTKLKKQYARLLEENKKILEELTNYKSRLLNYQSVISTERQQSKLKLKQLELRLQNSKKEVELIRQAEQRLIAKNKNYVQKNQQLHWQIKELQIKFTDQTKKIRKSAQRDLSQLIQKSQKQVADLKNQLNVLKNNEISPLVQQNTSLKRNIELLQKQKIDLEKQRYEKQMQIKNINQEFAEILKVRKQNQILKKNCFLQFLFSNNNLIIKIIQDILNITEQNINIYAFQRLILQLIIQRIQNINYNSKLISKQYN